MCNDVVSTHSEDVINKVYSAPWLMQLPLKVEGRITSGYVISIQAEG